MIGERLKELRENCNMNKKEFANYIGVKYTTYNGYETESREPASDFLLLISDKFNISVDYLLGRKIDKNILHSYQLKISEYNHIKKYRDLDPHGKDIVDTVLDKEHERCVEIKKSEENNIVQMPDRSYLAPDAAHNQTNIKPTADDVQADDDIMNDDSEWK